MFSIKNFLADLFTFIEEILHGKLHFLSIEPHFVQFQTLNSFPMHLNFGQCPSRYCSRTRYNLRIQPLYCI